MPPSFPQPVKAQEGDATMILIAFSARTNIFYFHFITTLPYQFIYKFNYLT